MTDQPAFDAPTIDLDAAGRLLRRIEAHHEQGGWHDDDGHLWVYVVFDHHDVTTGYHITRTMSRMGEPVRNARYSAQPMFPARLFRQNRQPTDGSPMDGLRRVALNLAYVDLDQFGDIAEPMGLFRQLLKEPGILAFVATYEAYGLKPGPLGRLIDNHAGGVQSQPDAKELRVAVMVDVNDHIHRVRRWRGETAELTSEPGARGNATTSLRLLMDATRGRLPELGSDAFHERYADAGMYFDMA